MMILGWLFFSVATGMFASLHRNRSGIGWFFVALFFTPLVAFVLLAILHPAAPTIAATPTPTPANDEPGYPVAPVLAREPVQMHKDTYAAGILLAAVVLVMLVFATGVYAQQQVVRDASGRTVGTITQSGNQTTFRDASGRTSGTAVTNTEGTTVFRDASGSTTGTISSPPPYRR
jgi:YD repeat-containing protein